MLISSVDPSQSLLDVIGLADADGRLDELSFAKLQSVITAMEAVSPIPDPIDRPDKVDGNWKTVFASFGPRHTAGKPQRHQSTLKLQSFNALPDLPIQVTEIYQEIDSQTGAYNNVIHFDTMNGTNHGLLIITGTYSRDDVNPKRFHVVFHRAHIVMGDFDDAAIRSALGMAEDGIIDGRFKASKIYSDIVYLDDEIRVNKGSVGGTYVLKRWTKQCLSI